MVSAQVVRGVGAHGPPKNGGGKTAAERGETLREQGGGWKGGGGRGGAGGLEGPVVRVRGCATSAGKDGDEGIRGGGPGDSSHTQGGDGAGPGRTQCWTQAPRGMRGPGQVMG